MSIQSTAGSQQDYRNCTHSLNNSFSGLYQPQAQNHTNAHSPSCFEPLYDDEHMSSGQTNESRFHNLIDTEASINQSVATLTASDDLCRSLSDVGLPSIRPPTIQCDPWCSAAMNRQVHSSEMLSWDDALAKCGAKISYDQKLRNGFYHSERALPMMAISSTAPDTPCLSPMSYVPPTPYLSPTTILATKDLTRSTRPNDGSLMAMPGLPVNDAQLQGVSWGSTSVSSSSDKAHTPWNDSMTSSYTRQLIRKESGTFPGLSISELVPYGDGEQGQTSGKSSNAERLPHRYFLPFSEYSAQDDHPQMMPLGVTSPNYLTSLIHRQWNGNTVSSYPHLPIPKDDGTTLGLHDSGFALHGDREQWHTLDRGLRVEQGPSEHCVPFEYLPACRSNPRRKKRRFTNGEKALINYKRKIGVCGDCRQAKRKCTHVQVDTENEVTESGAGAIKTQLRGSSVFDGPRRSKIGVKRRDSDIQEQGL